MASATTKRRSRAHKDQRLEARINSQQKKLIERAAQLRGTTVTEFVVLSAQEAAVNTINEFETLTLRGEAARVFVNALLNPPEPNKTEREAAARYKARMGM